MRNFTGIIAEYNPFHNGHRHQLDYVRSQGAEVIAVAMSGNFVQRGAPAWTDKYLRTRMALSQGADLVFELPTVYCLSSAENFAFGGISLLNTLKLDSFCFGCETPELSLLEETTDLLVEEPEAFRTALQAQLKSGASYPAARAYALRQCLPALPAEFLSGANNILSLEYLKAVRRLHSEMTPFPLLRSGQDYHNTDIIPDAFSSASAIRHSYEKASSLEKCADAMPEEVYELLAGHPDRFGISLSDFDLLLYYALRRACRNGTLTGYGDISTELANRLEKELASYKDADSFILSLKRKNITYARISRCLFQLLLEIPSTVCSGTMQPVPYLRLLGMCRSKSSYLRRITEVPIITKPANAWAQAASSPYSCATDYLKIDFLAADLYRQVLSHKTGCLIPDEYHSGVIIMED